MEGGGGGDGRSVVKAAAAVPARACSGSGGMRRAGSAKARAG